MAKKKKRLREFDVTYRCEVKRTCTIEAYDEADARAKFDKGDYDEEHEIECINIDDVCIEAVDDDDED